MRAYLIVPPGADPDAFSGADALVIDGRTPSSRAEGGAIRGRLPSVADVAPDRCAALAMTGAEPSPSFGGSGAPRRLIRVEGSEAPDLDARLADAAASRPDAIVLPAHHGREVARLGARLAVLEAEHGLPDGGIGIVALVACAAGALAAGSFVGASPRLRGLGWEAEALARQLDLPDGPWASSPVLVQARAAVRLAAGAAGVEAIEAAYRGDDAGAFRGAVAAARRDGFGAMLARDPVQARLIRAGV